MSVLRRLKAEETKEREMREQIFVERLKKMRWEEEQERLKLMDSIKVQLFFYMCVCEVCVCVKCMCVYEMCVCVCEVCVS